MLKRGRYLLVFAACIFSITACVPASEEHVLFQCDNSISPSDFARNVLLIAQTHEFLKEYIESPRNDDLVFKGYFGGVTYLYVDIDQPRSKQFRLLIVQYGRTGKLPIEAIDVFNSIVHEVREYFMEGCRIVGDKQNQQ